MKTGDAKMAATLFVLIGEETASEVLRHLNESEIETITREISSVGPIVAEEAEKAAEELYASLVANSYVSEGGMRSSKKTLKYRMSKFHGSHRLKRCAE